MVEEVLRMLLFRTLAPSVNFHLLWFQCSVHFPLPQLSASGSPSYYNCLFSLPCFTAKKVSSRCPSLRMFFTMGNSVSSRSTTTGAVWFVHPGILYWLGSSSWFLQEKLDWFRKTGNTCLNSQLGLYINQLVCLLIAFHFEIEWNRIVFLNIIDSWRS